MSCDSCTDRAKGGGTEKESKNITTGDGGRDMAAVLGHIEPFDIQNDDWSLYIERLGQFYIANEITTNAKKVAVLLTVIGTKAYELLHSLLAPELPSTKSYDELVKVLEDHLKPKPLVIAERFKFHHRNQKDGETVAQYVAALHKLMKHCDFKDYLDEALQDRLICGLRSEVIQRKLLSEKTLGFQLAYELAHSLETANRQASELQATTRAAVHPQRDVQVVAPGNPTSTSVGAPSCHRCGKMGHAQDKCYYRLQKCRACGKRGHIAKMCKSSSQGGTFGRDRTLPGGNSGHRAGHVEIKVPSDSPCESTQGFEAVGLFTVQMAEGDPEAPITLHPEVNGVTLAMELDTGASVSLISERV